MKYKTFLKQLIVIAERGNSYSGGFSEKQELEVGNVIADIQNWLGENDILLGSFGLEYNPDPSTQNIN